IVICGIFISIDYKIRPLIKTVSSYQAKVFATKAINDAIAIELENQQLTYEDMVHITKNREGNITSIQTDMIRVNALKSKLTNATLEYLYDIENQVIGIPIGTLIGGQIFSGRGPKLEFTVSPSGFVQTEIYNNFTSAGINQTLHQIMLNLNIRVTSIIPGYTVSTDVSTNFCIAETIIVGLVPDTYFSSDKSPTDLFNYKNTNKDSN
ncbi:MAG: sporulation protein YunB, partial [Oscillospiraceae bacterium]